MDSLIEIAAHDLAVHLSDENEIPTRFRKKEENKEKRQKHNPNSLIEKNFRENVTHWKEVISVMLQILENDQAWRFVKLSPEIKPDITSCTQHPEFRAFHKYLTRRRNLDNCDAEELGRLAMLSVAFQRKIEEDLKKQESAL